jgi:hypothetical protein
LSPLENHDRLFTIRTGVPGPCARQCHIDFQQEIDANVSRRGAGGATVADIFQLGDGSTIQHPTAMAETGTLRTCRRSEEGGVAEFAQVQYRRRQATMD